MILVQGTELKEKVDSLQYAVRSVRSYGLRVTGYELQRQFRSFRTYNYKIYHHENMYLTPSFNLPWLALLTAGCRYFLSSNN